MKHHAMLLTLVALTTGIHGCASISDELIECEIGARNQVLAQKAWGHWSWVYDDLEFPYHFARGFKAGYRDILDGGAGCQPTLPPQCYWKPCYQTPEGKCQIHAWFDGFSHGALAAKQDGYGDLGAIPISPTARTNLQMARSEPLPQDVFFADKSNSSDSPVGLGLRETTPLLSPTPSSGNSTDSDLTLPTPVRPYE